MRKPLWAKNEIVSTEILPTTVSEIRTSVKTLPPPSHEN